MPEKTRGTVAGLIEKILYPRAAGLTAVELPASVPVQRPGLSPWHGVTLHQPDRGDSSHSLAFTAKIPRSGLLEYVILNAQHLALALMLALVGLAMAIYPRFLEDVFRT